MKFICFIIATALALLFFGLQLTAGFMGLLCIGLGVGVDAAMTIGIVMTITLVVWMAVKNVLL